MSKTTVVLMETAKQVQVMQYHMLKVHSNEYVVTLPKGRYIGRLRQEPDGTWCGWDANNTFTYDCYDTSLEACKVIDKMTHEDWIKYQD